MGKRFLVVTAEEAEAANLRRLLSAHADIDWARTLPAALEHISLMAPDLIILDQALNGLDTLSAAAPRVPIVTLHEHEDGDVADALQRGARGFLVQRKYDHYLLPQILLSLLAHDETAQRFEMHRARAQITLNSIDDAVVSTGPDGRIDFINAAASKISGWPQADALHRPVQQVLQFLNKDTFEPLPNPLSVVLGSNRPLRLPAGTILVRRDGTQVAIEDSTAPIRDVHGALAGAVIVFHDVTAAQQMVERMSHLATHDFLTNLPNRVKLHVRIDQSAAHGRRDGSAFAILYLDLDNFKHVNDSLGHPTGDRLLCSLAERLQHAVRASDTVSRQGGDEFIILLADQLSPTQTAATADKLLARLSAPHHIDEHELHISASIGISMFPTDGDDAVTLIKNADTAMYIAKDRGRNNYQFFEHSMNARAVERQLVETNLRHALERDEFVLYYQPKINLVTGAVIGAEALIRWIHPQWGMVPPDRFIRVAEDFGLIVAMGRWVLHQACTQAKHWQDAGMHIETIAVNVSAVEFRRPEFIACVQQILGESGLRPACLELEITESVLMNDAEGSRAILTQLKQMGIRLAVDDFGTGYSSLSYLKLFPVDVLKIDRSFVSCIGTAGDDGAIATAVIAMGNSLNFRVVAEGVEDQFQRDFLRSHHCDEGQGFFFGAPVAPGAFEHMLARHVPERAAAEKR
ncbi:MAG: EAL domain-containing protein [Telluria sp.]